MQPLSPPPPNRLSAEMCNEDVNQQERDKLQFDSGQTFAESEGEAICGGERQWTLLGWCTRLNIVRHAARVYY